jgi:hypothetical protein
MTNKIINLHIAKNSLQIKITTLCVFVHYTCNMNFNGNNKFIPCVLLMNQKFQLIGYFKESTFCHPKILKPLLIIIFDYQEYIKPCHILELDPMSKLFIDKP